MWVHVFDQQIWPAPILGATEHCRTSSLGRGIGCPTNSLPSGSPGRAPKSGEVAQHGTVAARRTTAEVHVAPAEAQAAALELGTGRGG